MSPRSGVIDADTRRAAYSAALGRGRRLYPHGLAAEIRARELPVYVHGSANQSGSPGLVPNVAHWFDGAYQHRMRNALFASHYIQAIPHPVNQIDIGVTRRTEHHGIAFGPSARRVRGQILRTLICLGLDDATYELFAAMQAHEMHADEFTRHYQRAASVESARELQLRPCAELLVPPDV